MTASAPAARGNGRATQATRLLAVAVEGLPADSLLLTEFSGLESISSLYEFELKCVSERPDQIKLEKIVQKAVGVRIRLHDGSVRHINGIISRCSCDGREVGGDKRYTKYTLTMVPWLWLLTRRTDCRIFQDKTAPEIIEAVFQELGLLDFKNALTATYERRDYCVQYRETDFNFVSRLMEEEGIFYYFEHTSDGHQLMLADTPQALKPCPHQESARFDPEKGIGEREDRVSSWSEQRELRSGKVTFRDHHFQLPQKALEFNVQTQISPGGSAALEIYDYPGDYAPRFNKPEQRLDKVEPLGSHYAKLRMEAEEARHLVAVGTSCCRAFFVGAKFNFEAPSGLTSGEFLLTRIQHEARCQAPYVSGASGDAEEEIYTNEFTCIPASVPFRPPLEAEKPIVHGLQTAVVVGPPGEEIYPDKFGRVKVQFPWDRRSKFNEHSSCWVRSSQTHAAPGFGGMSLPRIGEEVVISFLEGNPDRPLIIGRVYNAHSMPPFELPKEMTRSGIKTNTHKGSGYNEMTMDDTAGKEQIRIHGQYDMNTTVKHDETHDVGNDRARTVGQNESIVIGNNRTKSVVSNETTTIGLNRAETVGANENITIGANRTENVGQNEMVTISLLRTHTIGVNDMLNVGVAQQVSVGGARSLIVGAAQTTTIGGMMVLEVGSSMSETIGKTLTIEAGDQILLKTGNASLLMKKDGTITITGKVITAQATEDIKLLASKEADIAADTFTIQAKKSGQVKSSTTLEVKSGLVRINC